MSVAVPIITGAMGQALANNLAWSIAANTAMSTSMMGAVTSLGGNRRSLKMLPRKEKQPIIVLYVV